MRILEGHRVSGESEGLNCTGIQRSPNGHQDNKNGRMAWDEGHAELLQEVEAELRRVLRSTSPHTHIPIPIPIPTPIAIAIHTHAHNSHTHTQTFPHRDSQVRLLRDPSPKSFLEFGLYIYIHIKIGG